MSVRGGWAVRGVRKGRGAQSEVEAGAEAFVVGVRRSVHRSAVVKSGTAKSFVRQPSQLRHASFRCVWIRAGMGGWGRAGTSCMGLIQEFVRASGGVYEDQRWDRAQGNHHTPMHALNVRAMLMAVAVLPAPAACTCTGRVL